jgi:hypothetical protein
MMPEFLKLFPQKDCRWTQLDLMHVKEWVLGFSRFLARRDRDKSPAGSASPALSPASFPFLSFPFASAGFVFSPGVPGFLGGAAAAGWLAMLTSLNNLVDHVLIEAFQVLCPVPSGFQCWKLPVGLKAQCKLGLGFAPIRSCRSSVFTQERLALESG